MRAPDTSLSSYICHRDIQQLGRVKETGEALVATGQTRKPLVPISQFSPRGLRVPFRKNFFQLYRIPFLGGEQGVGRTKTIGDQRKFTDDLCVVLPIKKWDVLRADGTAEKTVTGSSKGACVAFKTRQPVIFVELTWDTSDDLDISVQEPDKDFVNAFSPKSEAGRLSNDDTAMVCGASRIGRESILYPWEKRNFVKNGKYIVTITHFTNCGNGPSKWRLRITVDDKVVRVARGRTNKQSGETVATAKFSVFL